MQQDMASPAIELRGVEVSFDQEPLFSGIDLTVAKRERLVIIGPSGHGKSTLLKVMSGLLRPTKGQVLVDGVDLWAVSEKERQKLVLKMGMLFQKNALFDSLSSLENIAFPLREVTDRSESSIRHHAEDFLERVGISHARDLLPDEISGGMQKRLGIARALALDPKLIFYDDPTAGLDPITSRMIIDLILRLQQQNEATFVAITNDMNRAFQMATRLTMLIDGELLVMGGEEETRNFDDERVQQFITGRLEGPLTEGL